MFKLLQVQLPVQPMAPPANRFHTYAVSMPSQLLPILQSRLTCLIVSKLYDVKQPHDLTTHDMISLDGVLSQYEEDTTQLPNEAHNLVLDGRELGLLKRFLQAERVILGRSQAQMVMQISNPDLWVILGDLLESVLRPTKINDLSFYARA